MLEMDRPVESLEYGDYPIHFSSQRRLYGGTYDDSSCGAASDYAFWINNTSAQPQIRWDALNYQINNTTQIRVRSHECVFAIPCPFRYLVLKLRPVSSCACIMIYIAIDGRSILLLNCCFFLSYTLVAYQRYNATHVSEQWQDSEKVMKYDCRKHQSSKYVAMRIIK